MFVLRSEVAGRQKIEFMGIDLVYGEEIYVDHELIKEAELVKKIRQGYLRMIGHVVGIVDGSKKVAVSKKVQPKSEKLIHLNKAIDERLNVQKEEIKKMLDEAVAKLKNGKTQDYASKLDEILELLKSSREPLVVIDKEMQIEDSAMFVPQLDVSEIVKGSTKIIVEEKKESAEEVEKASRKLKNE